MPDTLTEEDLLQPNETAPKEVKEQPHQCPYCAQTFKGGIGGQLSLGRHKAREHSDKPKTPPVKRTPAKRTPSKAVVVRKDASGSIAEIFGSASAILRPIDPVMSGVLGFEAPAAGVAIDGLIAGTFVDKKAVQPMLTGREKWESVSAILALPLLIKLVQINPAMAIPLETPLRRAVGQVLVASLPVMRKKVAEDKKLKDALIELKVLDPVFAEIEDPVGAILMSLLNPEAESTEATDE
jgi:hypothetical protein